MNKKPKRGRPTALELLPKPHVLAFDIETTDLSAARGHILCICAKWLGTDRMQTWRIDDYHGYGKTPASLCDDKQLVAAFIEEAKKADALSGFYSGPGKFDVPFVSTRAVYHGLPPIPPDMPVVDPHRIARKRLKLDRNSLDMVSRILGSPVNKTHEGFRVWELARYGCRKSLDKIAAYCAQDVEVLIHTLQRIRPLMAGSDFPRLVTPADQLQRDTQCPACGSLDTSPRGSRATRTGKTERRQCNSCSVWFAGARERINKAKAA